MKRTKRMKGGAVASWPYLTEEGRENDLLDPIIYRVESLDDPIYIYSRSGLLGTIKFSVYKVSDKVSDKYILKINGSGLEGREKNSAALSVMTQFLKELRGGDGGPWHQPQTITLGVDLLGDPLSNEITKTHPTPELVVDAQKIYERGVLVSPEGKLDFIILLYLNFDTSTQGTMTIA